MVDFLNLKRINSKHEENFKSSFSDFLNSGHYILGQQVTAFENEFSKYNNVKYSIGVANGLDALILILKAAIELQQLKLNDEVLVPANTYIATILAIHLAGLKPVLIEPDLLTYNINPAEIVKKISSKTKAIMVVHLYGRICPMKEISDICQKNNLLLFEDCAQSQGATLNNTKAGAWGIASGFSFYPGKNLGALGDGGAITTSDDQYRDVLVALRNYGSHKKYVNNYIGLNSRLDELQASFLRHRLRHLDSENLERIQIAKKYDESIHNKLVVKPILPAGTESVWHLYTVLVSDREKFMKHMTDHQIGTLIHYPIAPHHQKAYQDIITERDLPITEKIHQEIISLPIYPTMTDVEINLVIEAVNAYK